MTTVYTPLSSTQQQQLGNSTTNSTKEVAMTKPKRPLSSYNLFYRFKRQHIIELGKGQKKDDIIALVAIQPGLENTYPNIPTDASTTMSIDEINEIRKTNIRNDMINNLCPRETSTRRHRKNSNAMNGEMSFLELGKLMNSSWQSCDEFAKTVFNDLANEGRELYRQRMAKYNLLTNEIAEDHHRNMIMSSTQQQPPQGAPQVYTSTPTHGMMGGVSPLPSMKRKVSPTDLLQQQMGGVVSMGEGLSTKDWVQSMSNMLSNNSNSMMGHPQQQSSPVPYMGPQGMQGQFSGISSPYQGLSRTHSPQEQGGPGYRRLVTQDIELLETNRNKLCANMKALEEELNAAKLRVRVYELEAQQKHQEELFREQMMRMQQASVASSASRGGTLAPTLPPLPGVSPQDVNTGQMGMMMSQEEMKEQMMRHFSNHHNHNGDSPSASSNIMSGQTTLREVASHLTPSVAANHSRRVSSLSLSSPSSQQDQQSQDGLSWLASAASSIVGGGGSAMSMSSMNQMPPLPLPLNADNDQREGSSSNNKKQRLS